MLLLVLVYWYRKCSNGCVLPARAESAPERLRCASRCEPTSWRFRNGKLHTSGCELQISCWEMILQFIDTFQVSLKSGKSNGLCTWCLHASERNRSCREKCTSRNSCRFRGADAANSRVVRTFRASLRLHARSYLLKVIKYNWHSYRTYLDQKLNSEAVVNVSTKSDLFLLKHANTQISLSISFIEFIWLFHYCMLLELHSHVPLVVLLERLRQSSACSLLCRL
jgi:hypothetical protein